MSRKSATVLALADYRTKHRTLYFTRPELNQLLSLYSRQVARGVWRDYAIDHRDGMALFSVFRHTQEAPAYSIVKTAPARTLPSEFIVQSGRQRLRAAHSLAEALEYFQTRLSLVLADRG
jgi:DNA-binding IclR family transcriptional regulator